MNDESDSRMVRLPVREMRDETKPQRAAQEGDLPPLLTDEQIDRAIPASTEFGARQLPWTAHDMRILRTVARAIESEVRTAIAAAGGRVPPGWRDALEDAIEALEWHASFYCADSLPDLTVTALQKLRTMLASSPQPEAEQAAREFGREFAQVFPGAQPEAAPAVAQVPHWSHSCNALCVDDLKLWVDTCPHCGMPRAATPEAPAQLNPAYRVAPVDPTLEMIDAGAQRLVSWGENSTWPDSWDALQVEAARTEADRCYRSMILVAPGPEAPAQAAQSAGEVERGDVVAFEFYNRATGHAIVDYSVNTHVGNLSADKGYEARPMVYAAKREEVADGSKPIPLWQAREALDELEAAARGDAPFNHQAAAVVRAALSHKEPQR